MLADAGAEDAVAVQIGGPSGQMIGEDDFGRTICYDDLATGGSIMIFGPDRDLLKVVDYFMEFFIEESCGYCTPCRVGNVLLKSYLDKILEGKGSEADLETMKALGTAVKTASRCGLGQTSPNPILTTLEKFRPEYEKLLKEAKGEFLPSFDIDEVLRDAQEITGRKSVHFS
jgi:[NiFe] hydrogenase diaphorase moiety large subunit